MTEEPDDQPSGRPDPRSRCLRCKESPEGEWDITMAYQPIVNANDGSIFTYEALVRGPNGAPAPSVLARVEPDTRYTFDQACRVTAIRLAAALGLSTRLSINFMPNAVYQPRACIQATLRAAREVGFPNERLIFEVSEKETVDRQGHLAGIFAEYQELGFQVALDDFGAGHSGLTRLTELEPDELKIDLALVRDIHRQPRKQSIVRGIEGICRDLGVTAIAEGVENRHEAETLVDLGIDLQQGFYWAKPGFESLPAPLAPPLSRVSSQREVPTPRADRATLPTNAPAPRT